MARQSGRRMAKFDKKGRSISQHQAYTELIKQENKMRKFVSLQCNFNSQFVSCYCFNNIYKSVVQH